MSWKEFSDAAKLHFLDCGLDEYPESPPEDSEDKVVYTPFYVNRGESCQAEKCFTPFSLEPAAPNVETAAPNVETAAPNVETAATKVGNTTTAGAMECIQRYSGGGGLAQKTFKQDVKTVYNKMLRDPQQHLLMGLCQMEYIKLVGPRLGGEARQVHTEFVEKFDHENPLNPILEVAREMEMRREIWRNYRRDIAAWSTMGSNSGFNERPVEPDVREPGDLERFFNALEARFKSSTTENLTAIQSFKPALNETPERMFARFNMLCKPLEDEVPCVMTRDQLKTTFEYNLHLLLTSSESEILNRDVRDKERKRVNRGQEPLTRYDIHNMVLRQQREKILALTKLRAVGLVSTQKQDALPPRRTTQEKEKGRASEPQPDPTRISEREKRKCNNCGKRGHIASQCWGTTKEGAADDRPEKRRPEQEVEESPSKRHINDRLGPRKVPPVVPGRESAGRPVNPRNTHMTEGVTCSHCNKPNHTAAQCWKLHPDLAPFPKKERVMMSQMVTTEDVNYTQWEAEQNAREKRALQYEAERERRELQYDSRGEEEQNMQFMVSRVYDEGGIHDLEYNDLFDLDDPALEAELQLMENPIHESPRVLRQRQEEADKSHNEMTPMEQVDSWLHVDGKSQRNTATQIGLTYANVVGTRSGVTGGVHTPTSPGQPQQSPRKRVQIVEEVENIRSAPTQPPTNDHEVPRRVRNTRWSPPPRAAIRRRTLPLEGGGEMFTDDGAPGLPMSFPLQEMGEPTPGTTDLRHPPESARPLPPPPPTPSSSDSPTPSLDQVPRSAYSASLAMCIHMRTILSSAENLTTRIREERELDMSRPIGPPTIIRGSALQAREEERYQAVQKQNRKKMTMATLINGDGQLQIEGLTPKIAVLDTGASAVILGRDFANAMAKCRTPWLARGGVFVTANGQENQSLGRTIKMLEFIIAKGTHAETKIHVHAMVADTNAYDVILGMDFLAECLGYVDPLTEEFFWRVDCGSTTTVPHQMSFLPVKCRGTMSDRRNTYSIKVINSASEMHDALLGDENLEDNFDLDETRMTCKDASYINKDIVHAYASISHNKLLTKAKLVDRKIDARARLEVSYRKGIPVLNPRTKWVGGEFSGAKPVDTSISKFSQDSIHAGLHVLDLFSGITCGGLRTVLEAGYKVKCYTSVEIDDISRAISREVLSKLQEEYPGQLPDKAIRGYNKRLPHNIALVTVSNLMQLMKHNGNVHFICGGWECQSMSMAGLHKGMEDDRFPPFLDMVKIVNFLQKEQPTKPLYLFENTWPGKPGQYPRVDKAAQVVEAFLGAPIVVDAACVGSVAHRVRLFWTNWCQPEILQDAFPRDVKPYIPLDKIMLPHHIPIMPTRSSSYPFATHNVMCKPRVCMPTIVSFPKSHAYRMQANGMPGEGQLWNRLTRTYEEPTIEEKEQMMGYQMGETCGGLATPQQRAKRLGQAMDGNTMRWFGAFLYAQQQRLILQPNYSTSIHPVSAFTVEHNKVENSSNNLMDTKSGSYNNDPHYQACAVVEQILQIEVTTTKTSLGGGTPNHHLGGGDIQNTKRHRPNTPSEVVTRHQNTPGGTPDRDKETMKPKKWKIGEDLRERDQLDVLKTLSENNDRFAYSIEDLGLYTGPQMEIHVNSQKDIFRPPHKLGEKEMTFVGEQCEKLEKLGFIRKSEQSHYASATVVVRKKNENGDYTDFRKCGDYRPINSETDLDRYQLPLIDTIFNEMKGAKIFSKLDLRSGYHQMGLRECDRSKTAFWGAHRILWEWCVVPFGLKNAPPYFQRQMDKVLINMSFARCYIDDIVVWSENLQDHLKHLSAVFDRLRKAGLKVHPGKCEFALDKINFLGHCVSAEGLSPQQEKVTAVRDLPAPTDISSLRSALGLFSYYRKFVQGFSVLASPLHLLLRKGEKWHWDLDQQKSFAELKDKLCTSDVLKRPDSELPYVLATDWSQKGMGAVLSQIDKDGKEHPISYASRSCNPAEKNYGSCEGECLAVVWATQHFREFLFGTPFTLITDHEPLKWLMQTNKTTGKLARWSLLLQEYDMKVLHKRGVLNTNADCLSRFPKNAPSYEPPLPDWNKGDYNVTPATVFAFMEEQPIEKDEENRLDIWEDTQVLHFLKNHEYQDHLNPLQKDRVYRRAKGFRWLAHNLYKLQLHGMQMLLVPIQEERLELVKKIHRDMGHFGVKRVMDRLKKTYWWKGMEATTEEIVKACMPCARTKAGFRVSGTHLQPLHLQGLMFRWGVDFAGPMLATKRGNKYVLVCIEHCTKWVELIPLPSKSSEGVARAFLDIISRYGVPGVVLTDGGTEFQGEFQILLTQQQITHRVTSRDNPQADGLAERMVQTLKQSLRRCLLDQSWGIPWDDILPYVAMGYRISKQKSTGFSPYFLLYGRDPLFPSTIQHLEENQLNLEDTNTKLMLELAKRSKILKRVMPIAMRNLAIAQQRDKERFHHVRGGKYLKPMAKFVVGDYVLVQHDKTHSLEPSVTPHILRIVEIKDTGVVVLQGRDAIKVSRRIEQLAHCSVPVADHKIYPELFQSTDRTHCEICMSRQMEAKMLLCDTCNKGFHTFCLDIPIHEVPTRKWYCPTHKVN